MTTSILLGLALVQTGAQTALDPNRQIEGFALITIDKSLIKRTWNECQLPKPLPDVKKYFASKRFEVHPWGRRSAIVIDRDMPMIKSKLDEIALLDTVTKYANPDGYIEVSQVPEDDQKRLFDLFNAITPTYDYNSFKKTTIGIGIGRSYAIEGPGGVVKGATAGGGRVPDEGLKRMRSSSVGKNPDEAAIKRGLEESIEANLANMNFGSQWYGISGFLLPEGLAETGKVMEKVFATLRLEKGQASKRLGAKLGALDPALVESLPYSGLSEEERDRLRHDFVALWQINGFANRAEAELFLNGAGKVRPSVDLSLRISTGDRTGFGIQIGRFGGG